MELLSRPGPFRQVANRIIDSPRPPKDIARSSEPVVLYRKLTHYDELINSSPFTLGINRMARCNVQLSVPEWDRNGVLPPINTAQPTSMERSPYMVTLEEFVTRYSLTDDRIRIMNSFLQYRAALHGVGLSSGFQWVDGSFLENVEALEQRSPKDLDVVTFFRLPPGKTQADVLQNGPHLFDPTWVRRQFHVDGYFVSLDVGDPEYLVRGAAYWYSVWAHRRDHLWKGFVQIDLSPAEDAPARKMLSGDLKFGEG